MKSYLSEAVTDASLLACGACVASLGLGEFGIALLGLLAISWERASLSAQSFTDRDGSTYKE